MISDQWKSRRWATNRFAPALFQRFSIYRSGRGGGGLDGLGLRWVEGEHHGEAGHRHPHRDAEELRVVHAAAVGFGDRRPRADHRGRESFAKLDPKVQEQLENDLATHLKANPVPAITRMDGTPIEEGTPIADLIVPGQVQDLPIHPDAVADLGGREGRKAG